MLIIIANNYLETLTEKGAENQKFGGGKNLELSDKKLMWQKINVTIPLYQNMFSTTS